MSSSDIASPAQHEAVQPPLIRLLMAMAVEWTLIASQVEGLGTAVSNGAAGHVPDPRHLQAFDLIHQRAQGQANLLNRLSRKLSDDAFFDRKRLVDLIADIPFYSVREGLEAAFEGRSHMPAESQDDVEWL